MLEALGIDLKEIIFAMVNFLILVGVLAKFIYKPFLGALESRKQRIRDQFDQADAVSRKADAKLAAYTRRISNAEDEAREILRVAKQKADERSAQIVQEAHDEAAAIIAKAEKTIEQEKDKAIEDLRDEIAELALLAAEQIVGGEIEKTGQDAIVDRVIRNARNSQWQN
ncbi:MAG: F0F1 ATP synthase subunit B [Clostridiales bacterium]|nr:F0F1 ATP synthase subunit B [Clostridiales bacterium]MDD7035271.1 F0F1 ATP synthase subunit B [Bacillota bacterium]MDY2920766.1 F0F1 ATP synthase subunit B [Lentihominibacter sp.]